MSTPPSGTVTFLMTDVEGSTKLWEQYPEAMQAALTRHDALLKAGIEEYGGVVVKHRGEGDSLFAVFDRASAAVAAACLIQQRLVTESWSPALRVRIALHTGEAELREGDYFGPTVNRCARLRAVAHGGQILLSQATAQLVESNLPPAAVLLDLGAHRLRDLERPERVYQLLHPNLPAEFPPLRSLDRRPHNLPVQPAPLIGRQDEATAVRRLLLEDRARLLTLTGPGGIGKTRLALEVAAELIDDFDDGVFFVGLASISDPTQVVSTIAQTLGVREASGLPLFQSLEDFLRSQRLLLLLDNFEHVLPAATDVARLLASCAHLEILVTSRTVLHLTGEHVFALPPLALPEDPSSQTLDQIIDYEAVRLFVERARSVQPEFTLREENVATVLEICRRLEGLPLAIELAAARVRLLPPAAMLRRLDRRLPLLSGGARDLPIRHQTLRDTIAWSDDLLDENAQTIFHRLAVFTGGCTLEAAETVVAPALTQSQSPLDIFEGVSTLIDASLVRQTEMLDGEPRITMLETIREYARERLEASGESDAARRRHAAYCLALARQAEATFLGAGQMEWLNRLEREHDNLRAALSWAYEQDMRELLLDLAGSLAWFWFGRGHWTEGHTWLTKALAGPQEATLTYAKALNAAGNFCWLLGDPVRGRAQLEDSIRIYEQLGNRRELSFGLHILGMLLIEGEPAAARAIFERSLAIAREENHQWIIGATVGHLGQLAWRAGDLETARSRLQESASISRERRDWWSLAHGLNLLGDLARSLGEYAQAAGYYEESLPLFENLGIKYGRASVLHNLAYVAHHQGDEAKAISLFRESLMLFHELADQRGMAEGLVGLAEVMSDQGRPEQAARFLGAAQGLLDAAGSQISHSNIDDYQRILNALRSLLGADAFATAIAAGQSSPLDRVIAEALGGHPQ